MLLQELEEKSCGTDQSDMGPERQSGRKAQTANIVAAKVSSYLHTFSVMQADRLDRCRCDQDVFGTESDVEDDSRPHGWYLVSPLTSKSKGPVSAQLTVVQTHERWSCHSERD
jgi:hypothetical protein